MHNYFCGWYFKCQSNTQTLAVIPAFHQSKEGPSASIQFITDHNAWNIPFSYHKFFQDKNKFQIALGNNHFSKYGMQLSLHTTDCSVEGSLLFGAFSLIRYDIMGPFQFIPLFAVPAQYFKYETQCYRKYMYKWCGLFFLQCKRISGRRPRIFFSQRICLDTVFLRGRISCFMCGGYSIRIIFLYRHHQYYPLSWQRISSCYLPWSKSDKNKKRRTDNPARQPHSIR